MNQAICWGWWWWCWWCIITTSRWNRCRRLFVAFFSSSLWNVSLFYKTPHLEAVEIIWIQCICLWELHHHLGTFWLRVATSWDLNFVCVDLPLLLHKITIVTDTYYTFLLLFWFLRQFFISEFTSHGSSRHNIT